MKREVRASSDVFQYPIRLLTEKNVLNNSFFSFPDDLTGSSSISDNILPESDQDAISVMIQEPPETIQKETNEVIYEDEIQILGLVY